MTLLKAYAQPDGSGDTVRTRVDRGDLVKVPLAANVQAVAVGTATAAQGTSLSSTDGSMWGATLTVPPGLGNSAALKGLQPYGRFIGVRVLRTAAATNPRFTVVVNGVAYPVRNTANRRDNVVYGATDLESLFVVPVQDLIHDGPHSMDIILASDPYGGTTRTLTVMGLLLERSKGYTDYPALNYIPAAAIALGTSTTSLQSTTANPVRKLYFQNTDVATRVVTLKNGAATLATISLAAGADTAYDFGAPVNLQGFTAQADVAAKVNMWIQSGARPR